GLPDDAEWTNPGINCNWSLTCAAGTYWDADANACTACPAGSYCDSEISVNQDNYATSAGFEACPLGGTSAEGSDAITDCYKTCTLTGLTNGTITTNGAGNTSTSYNAIYDTDTNTYPACLFTISCNSGYTAQNNGTATPSCVQCGAGYYIENGVCTDCAERHYCPGDGTKQACPGGRRADANATNDRQCYIKEGSNVCGNNGCVRIQDRAYYKGQ
ncbi:MAG: hypothetical protein LBL75_04030, partial [Rickettsiales bacterium]|nr:hypothetical protein [Rickettsiales bacterium]